MARAALNIEGDGLPALNANAMAATHALQQAAAPSLFCFRPFFLHSFSSFLSSFFFSPRNFKVRYAPQYKGGSCALNVEAMGGMANAFFLLIFWGNAKPSRACLLYIPQSLPAPTVACSRYQSPPNAFPKKGIADSNFTKSDAAVLSHPARGEIDYGNSVVHCIAAHP